MTARLRSTLRTFGLTTEWAPRWWPPRLWTLAFWCVPGDVQKETAENRDTLEACRNVIKRMKAER